MSDTVSKPSHLLEYVSALTPVMVVGVDNEESRFVKQEASYLVKAQMTKKVYQWDITGELLDLGTANTAVMGTLVDLLQWFEKEETPKVDNAAANSDVSSNSMDLAAVGPKNQSVLFVLDAAFHMSDPQKTGHSNPTLGRMIKRMSNKLIEFGRTLVLVGKKNVVPPELEGVASAIEYPRPNEDYLRFLVQNNCQWFCPKAERTNKEKWLHMTETEEAEIVTLLKGFRAAEAENILARSFRENCQLRYRNPEVKMGWDVEVIRKAKIETIQQSGHIQIVLPPPIVEGSGLGMEKVGGAESLKKWWRQKMQMFNEDARHDGIDIPRGAVIFGLGGTGKDNIVEAIAEESRWTLIHADIGAAKAPLQGQSHANVRDIFRIAEMQAPCHLVFSEFEKMFAGGMSNSAALDGGTGNEIYATFLNWMQRRKAPVFVWGMTNSIADIPTPALRQGRFDAIWYMDIPTSEEREDIFRVHLRIKGWAAEMETIDIVTLAEMTDGFTGSEIRAVVNQALEIKHFTAGKGHKYPVTFDHLVEAIKLINPISKTNPEDLDELRKYANSGNFKFANSPKGGQTLEQTSSKQIVESLRGNLLEPKA